MFRRPTSSKRYARKVLRALSPSAAPALTDLGDRSGDWLKLRLNQGQEFVIGGYMYQVPEFSTRSWSASFMIEPSCSPRVYVPALTQR